MTFNVVVMTKPWNVFPKGWLFIALLLLMNKQSRIVRQFRKVSSMNDRDQHPQEERYLEESRHLNVWLILSVLELHVSRIIRNRFF